MVGGKEPASKTFPVLTFSQMCPAINLLISDLHSKLCTMVQRYFSKQHKGAMNIQGKMNAQVQNYGDG